MPVDCQRSTSGGKGNLGMFIERTPYICAAGQPSAEPDSKITDYIQHYLLKDEADALIQDAIHPSKKPLRPLPPLRKPVPRDMRNATYFSSVQEVMFSRNDTKFQTLVEECKSTVYASYWKPPGEARDRTPMMPEGFDKNTRFGKKTDQSVSLYDVVMPKVPLPDKTPPFKQAGVQKKRNYCEPFNPHAHFGLKSGINKSGICAKACMTDNKLVDGITTTRLPSGHANFLIATRSQLGKVLAPNDNIKEVSEGTSFGAPSRKPNIDIGQSLTSCTLYPDKEFIKKCFAHLNSVRKCLTTIFLPDFFGKFFLILKRFDTDKSGWLSKEIVYDQCTIKRIKFDPLLMEPLLALWKAFDGSRIEYKTFVHGLNYKQPSPEIPKIPDVPDKCISYQTTYREMIEPKCPDISPMAGVPSGRYFDCDYPVTPGNCCKADRFYLPQESDAKTCLNPSVFTMFNVSHRDMYAKREPEVVRKIFENIGEQFTDETFEVIWQEAMKHNSEGWVCLETFRQALIKHQARK